MFSDLIFGYLIQKAIGTTKKKRIPEIAENNPRIDIIDSKNIANADDIVIKQTLVMTITRYPSLDDGVFLHNCVIDIFIGYRAKG